MKTSVFLTLGLVMMTSCASYHYAQKVKTISFDDNVQKGQAVGPIRGEDCTWKVFSYQLGSAPTIDRAFMNAKNQADGMVASGFSSKTDASKQIRYINNVNTSNDGFDAFLFGKQCLVVTGVGYR